jgi:hypothetical protein
VKQEGQDCPKARGGAEVEMEEAVKEVLGQVEREVKALEAEEEEKVTGEERERVAL